MARLTNHCLPLFPVKWFKHQVSKVPVNRVGTIWCCHHEKDMIWIKIVIINVFHLRFILLHLLSFIIVTPISAKWPHFLHAQHYIFLISIFICPPIFIFLRAALLYFNHLTFCKISTTYILLVVTTKILIWDLAWAFTKIFQFVLPFPYLFLLHHHHFFERLVPSKAGATTLSPVTTSL